MYKIRIMNVAELTEEIVNVEFSSEIIATGSMSSKIAATIDITGRILYDADKQYMKDSTKAIAAWALKKPEHDDIYKKVTVELINTGEIRYDLQDAYAISYYEQFGDQNGVFRLVVKEVNPVANESSGNQEQIKEVAKAKKGIASDTNKHKGNFGEMSTDIDVEKKGPIDPGTNKPKVPKVSTTRVGDNRVTGINDGIRQGIDGIFKCNPPPPAFLVVESKFGSSQLSTTKGGIKQMSNPWIHGNDRIDKYFGVTPDTPLDDPRRKEMEEFLIADAMGDVQKELSQIDANGNVSRTILP